MRSSHLLPLAAAILALEALPLGAQTSKPSEFVVGGLAMRIEATGRGQVELQGRRDAERATTSFAADILEQWLKDAWILLNQKPR